MEETNRGRTQGWEYKEEDVEVYRGRERNEEEGDEETNLNLRSPPISESTHITAEDGNLSCHL